MGCGEEAPLVLRLAAKPANAGTEALDNPPTLTGKALELRFEACVLGDLSGSLEAIGAVDERFDEAVVCLDIVP
jgi:hypothetical protein